MDYVVLPMQLLALFSVNLITGIVLYIFFSLRFSRAIQKRDKGIVDAMRAISLETKTQSEEILEMAAKKQESIYQLTLHAERLLVEMQEVEERLTEKLSASSQKKQSSRKTSRKKASPATKTRAARTSGASKKKTTKKKGKVSSKPSPALPDLEQPPGGSLAVREEGTKPPAARILEQLGEDRLEITDVPQNAKAAFETGQLSKGGTRPSASAKAPLRQALAPISAMQVLEKAGRLIRRLFGDSAEYGQTLPPLPEVSAKAKDGPPVSPVSFEEIYKKELEASGALPPLEAKSAKEEPAFSSPESGRAPQLLPDLGLPSIRLGTEKPSVPPKKARLLSSEPLFSRPNLSRREKILILLEQGLSPNEIVSRLQVSRAEVELLNRLPARERPRRKRLST